MPKIKIILLSAVLFSLESNAREPDFYINFDNCKLMMSPLVLAENPIKTAEGDPTTYSCVRNGLKVNCHLDFSNGEKGVKGDNKDYEIILDSPPLLSLKLINGTENILINTSEHAAAGSSLMLDLKYLGSKVCHGSFFTFSEIAELNKKGR